MNTSSSSAYKATYCNIISLCNGTINSDHSDNEHYSTVCCLVTDDGDVFIPQ
jgi:hypothetical protein